jgi:hypothetical protein
MNTHLSGFRFKAQSLTFMERFLAFAIRMMSKIREEVSGQVRSVRASHIRSVDKRMLTVA